MSNSNKDFFALFSVCCGERKPKKSPIVNKRDDKRESPKEAPFLNPPTARSPNGDGGMSDFLNKCSGAFVLILSPIQSVASSLELSRELSQSDCSWPPFSNGDTTPRLTPAQPDRSPSPFPAPLSRYSSPTPRKFLNEALEVIGDLLPLSTPPNSSENSPRESKERPR